MPSDNKLELVVQVDVDKANASIKSVNAGLSSMEQTAAKAARGASAGIDGMTASMIKGATAGNLLADGIKKVVEWAKNWTVEAAKMAAHESRMEASGRALAKAHGIAAEAFEKAVEAVRKIGYHGEDAIHTIDRLIIADLDLSKATGLAKVAKDAAAIENIAAPEALEKILQAIEFGNARALRSAGLVVNFEREITTQELLLGRTLSDNEKVQARYNAIMKAATAIQGAHAGAIGEAELEMKALDREVHELREAVGVQFQNQFKGVLALLRDLTSFLRDNASWLVKSGEAALYVSAALATAALVSKIQGITGAVQGLTAALAANPWALMLTGIAAGGAIVYKTWKDTQAGLQERWDEEKRGAIRQDLFSGKTSVEALRKQGMTDDQLRELVSGSKAMPGQRFEYQGPKLAIDTGPDPEALKLAAEIRKKQAQIEQESRQAAVAAGAKSQSGFARDVAEVNAQVEKWTDEGKIQLTRQAWVNVIDQLERRWGAYKRNLSEENHKHLAEYLKDEEEAAARRTEYDAQVYQRRLQYDAEWSSKAMESARDLLAYQEAAAGIDRDARLRAVEATDAQTLRQKLAVEQQKMQIEVDYLERLHEIKLRLFDLETSQQAMAYELDMKRLGYEADAIGQRIAEYSQQREAIRQAQQEAADAGIEAARQQSANRTSELVRDQARATFDSVKTGFEGLMDAAFERSRSFLSALKNLFFSAFLTPVKQYLATLMANLLTGSNRPAGMGLGGLFGGLAASGAAAYSSIAPSMIGSLPLQTSRWWSAVPGGTGPTSVTSTASSGAGLLAANSVKFAQAGLAMGGASLLDYGLNAKSGTLGSFVGSAGGGAMMGAALGMQIGSLGGPVGMAVGAGAGAGIAGLRTLFGGGALKQVKDTIARYYGVNVNDETAQGILDLARSSYGGNIAGAIQSVDVQQLVELYALGTGQSTKHPTVKAGHLTQSSGLISGFASGGGTTVIPLQIDSQPLGQVIISNGRVVARGALNAARSNYGRREMLALQTAPNAVLA